MSAHIVTFEGWDFNIGIWQDTIQPVKAGMLSVKAGRSKDGGLVEVLPQAQEAWSWMASEPEEDRALLQRTWGC